MPAIPFLDKVKEFFLAGNELVVAFNEYLASHFGTAFQVGVDWVLLGLLLVLVLRLFKFSFDVLRYVVVPSLVISGLVAAFTSLSFLYVMPMAMGAGTVLMLFKS
jgi:hypothetical protein